MTRMTTDSGDVFPESRDGERLREAFAEEIDRTGLEGPSYDAVLRSGTARLRRRRATVGATFAAASVTAVATAVLATGGATGHDVHAADFAGTTNTAISTTTTTPPAGGNGLSASTSALSTPSRPATTTPTSADASHPADAVLAAGILDGHSWLLLRDFRMEAVPKGLATPPPDWQPQWCGSLNVLVDGVWTDAGSGGATCLTSGKTPQTPPRPDDPGFSSIAIIDQHHVRLGSIVAGVVSPLTASVTAQCGAKTFTDKVSVPAGDTAGYYVFTLPNGSGCPTGALTFFDASGSRVASLDGVGFEGGK